MCFQLIVLFIAVGAAVCDLNDCEVRVDRECFNERPSEFPSTPAGLRRDCDKALKTLKCTKDIFKNCTESQKDAPDAETILNDLMENCDENSNTFEELSRHVSCVGPIYSNINYACSPFIMSEEESEVFDRLAIEQFLVTERDLLHCGLYVQKITCLSVALSQRCGAELKDIVFDFFGIYFIHYAKHCTPEKLSKLQPFKEAYEGLLIQKDF